MDWKNDRFRPGKREYEQFSMRLANLKENVVVYPFIKFLVILIGTPLLISVIYALRNIFGNYILLVIVDLCGAVYFGTNAYQGIIKRHVRIIPKSRVSYRNEAGYVGGKIKEFVSGGEAIIVGIGFLGIGLIFLIWTVNYLIFFMEH
ncbi:MAG: hypothetical protein ABFS17_04875 [Chloroflexota bacterium]